MIRTVLRLLRQGVQDLTLNPLVQLLTFTAVTLVVFLAGLCLMAVVTLDHQMGAVRGETVFQLYWRPGVNLESVKEQWDNLKYLPDLNSIRTYTPAEALKEVEQRLGRGAGARSFPFLSEHNPLPATALLTFIPKDQDLPRWTSEITTYLKQLPEVERVSSTPLRDELGAAWRTMSTYVMRPAIGFLALVLGLLVGNTVRLALLSKGPEVEILQLVGAYPWYIRLPLLVCGAMQGFFGSLLALGFLRLMHWQVKDALNFPPIFMEIQFLPWEMAVLLVLVPTGMGFFGGWIGLKSKV